MISLSEILHTIAQALMIPCLIILIILMAGAVWQIGDIVVEYIAERREHKCNVPQLLRDFDYQSCPVGTHDLQCVINLGQLPFFIADIQNRSDDLCDFSCFNLCHFLLLLISIPDFPVLLR